MQRTCGLSSNVRAKGKKHRHHLMALLLIGITLAVFWPVHGHEFVITGVRWVGERRDLEPPPVPDRLFERGDQPVGEPLVRELDL